MHPLIHLIYASTATAPFDSASLQTLLRQSRESNARIGVTGMLLHDGGSFFQVLEGEEDVVVALYERIAHDTRHRSTVEIIREPIARRTFAAWTMAFSDVTYEDVSKIEGLDDFFGPRAMFARLGSGRAKKLVEAFGHGRWRQRLLDVSLVAA